MGECRGALTDMCGTTLWRSYACALRPDERNIPRDLYSKTVDVGIPRRGTKDDVFTLWNLE